MAGKDPKTPHPNAERKAKPRDVADTHKPSRKVALNEVLRSLQDLVNNELAPADEAAETKQPATPAETAPPQKPKSTATSPSKSKTVKVPPEGLQQEFELETISPSDVPESIAPTEPETQAAGIETQETVASPTEPQPEVPDTPAAPPEAPAIVIETPQTELSPQTPDTPAALLESAVEVDDLGEIPVLEDIIDLQEERSGAVPDASEARRIAIQVAAHLNVELRKAGKPGLNSDVITRLVRLLGEALAKAGANMENNPPEKHD